MHIDGAKHVFPSHPTPIAITRLCLPLFTPYISLSLFPIHLDPRLYPPSCKSNPSRYHTRPSIHPSIHLRTYHHSCRSDLSLPNPDSWPSLAPPPTPHSERDVAETDIECAAVETDVFRPSIHPPPPPSKKPSPPKHPVVLRAAQTWLGRTRSRPQQQQ